MHEVRWFAFVPALILAPLALAVPAMGVLALSAWLEVGFNPVSIVAFIAVFAAIFGAPTYLTFGAAAFWYAHWRLGPGAPFWAFGLGANVASTPAVAAFYWLTDPSSLATDTAFVVGFGCIFAPLWGGLFGWIYRGFVRKGDALRAAAHGGG